LVFLRLLSRHFVEAASTDVPAPAGIVAVAEDQDNGLRKEKGGGDYAIAPSGSPQGSKVMEFVTAELEARVRR
jgi:hypothetical protein